MESLTQSKTRYVSYITSVWNPFTIYAPYPSSNTISKPQLAEGTSVCHSAAMKRRKHARGKRCTSDAPLFMAPQTPRDLTPLLIPTEYSSRHSYRQLTSESTLARALTGRPTIRGSIPGTSKGFFSSPARLDRI